MIQAVTTPEHQGEFIRRLGDKPYFAATMGTHCALFAAHPASGWQFYLLPGSGALALRGGSAALCGTLPGGPKGEETEELQGFLRFLGVERLLCEEMPLSGWLAAEPLLLWELPQGGCLPLPAPPPAGLTLEEHPAMQPVSRLFGAGNGSFFHGDLAFPGETPVYRSRHGGDCHSRARPLYHFIILS